MVIAVSSSDHHQGPDGRHLQTGQVGRSPPQGQGEEWSLVSDLECALLTGWDSHLLASQLWGGTQYSTPKFWSLTLLFPITHGEAMFLGGRSVTYPGSQLLNGRTGPLPGVCVCFVASQRVLCGQGES